MAVKQANGRFTFKLSNETKELLEILAEHNLRSISSQVEIIVVQYLREHKSEIEALKNK